MRLLAIDYGIKNTGFAIGENGLAMPIEGIRTADSNTLLAKIINIIEQEKIEKIVVGIPVHKNTKQQKIVEEFISKLLEKIDIKIEVIDEKSTSKEAFSENYSKFSGIKKIKQKIHSISAQKILEKYYIKQTNL